MFEENPDVRTDRRLTAARTMAKSKKTSGGGWLLVLAMCAAVVFGVQHRGDAGQLAGSPDPGHGAFVRPADGPVTSGFGARWGTQHYGIDIANAVGAPIRSVAEGTVIVAGPATGFGLWMQVRHGDGTVTVYGHMNTMDRRVGDHVAAGEQIATIGQRGEATGPHLHFEVWPHGNRAERVDPAPWLAARGVRL
jgi:murein DD-endopeptidase MepM/ murein hydrolase activator NlpD